MRPLTKNAKNKKKQELPAQLLTKICNIPSHQVESGTKSPTMEVPLVRRKTILGTGSSSCGLLEFVSLFAWCVNGNDTVSARVFFRWFEGLVNISHLNSETSGIFRGCPNMDAR